MPSIKQAHRNHRASSEHPQTPLQDSTAAPQEQLLGPQRCMQNDRLATQSFAPQNLLRMPDVQRLQRSIGNQSVSRLLSRRVSQPTTTNTTGIPDQLKANIEGLSGLSMDGVQVHYNSSEPAQIKALAYTRGKEIHISSGQEHQLPHESWHVVQQMQGRVKPTGWLDGNQALNLDQNLESEADRMGAASIAAGRHAEPHQSPAVQSVNLPGTAVLQAKWYILPSGQQVWISAGDPVPPGAIPLQLTQEPEMLHPEEQGMTAYDSSGSRSVSTTPLTPAQLPPKNPDLEARTTIAAKELRKRAKKMPIQQLEAATRVLDQLAGDVEQIAGDSVPAKHDVKAQSVYEEGDFDNNKYRKIIPDQDEMVRATAAGAMFRGFQEPEVSAAPKTPPPTRKAVNNLGRAGFRLSSSARIPTRSVVATTEVGSKVQGSQHPTSFKGGWPKLPGGGSAHSYNDRARAEQALTSLEAALKDPNAPIQPMFVLWVLASVSASTERMAWPLSAQNVSSWNAGYAEEQRTLRERAKAMINRLAQHLGMEIATRSQGFSDKYRAHSTPASPLRESQPETLTLYQQRYDTLEETLTALLTAAPSMAAATKQPVNILHTQVKALDRNDPMNMQQLHEYYQSAYNWFALNRAAIGRQLAGAGSAANNAAGARGLRQPSFRQFFHECGQMAVHNALVMDPAMPAPDSIANLGTLGAFENNISEEQIRTMLVAQARGDIPVIGNIDQMRRLVDIVERTTPAVPTTDSMIANLELFNYDVGATEQTGLTTINNFVRGHTNTLVAIVNTTGHLLDGYHWVAVRIRRNLPGGTLDIEYRDSFAGDMDYTDFFNALKASLG